jgi:leucine-rich melanocyte differentiation-associated protein
VNAVRAFQKLTYLVVDNNQLDGSTLPKLPKLHTLWVNNNRILDIELFVQVLKKNLPSLRYLSMLKNPACPNFFTGKEEDDYQRYR